MNNNFNSVFLTSVATAGKDTLLTILQEILGGRANLERYAFADNLKAEVNPFTTKMFGISSFTKNPQEKELIRNIFVETGLIKRIQSKGTYWWNLLNPAIQNSIDNNSLPVVTDLRYAIYSEDEHYFAKKIHNGIIVHITRLDSLSNPIQPPNEHERKNDPILKKLADYHLVWPTSNDREILKLIVNTQLKDLIEKICQKFQK